jgi:two-component system sensor histidine kinase KdpD
LEVLPRKQVEYHNVTLPELDVDSILSRRPQLVLVNEFAHTNAPDSRHLKRFQDMWRKFSTRVSMFTPP